MSSPLGAYTPPLESETAMHDGALLVQEPRQVAADVAEALHDDAQPLDALVLLAERIGDHVERARAVASSRPSEPPIASGLPVTTPRTEWPLFIE